MENFDRALLSHLFCHCIEEDVSFLSNGPLVCRRWESVFSAKNQVFWMLVSRRLLGLPGRLLFVAENACAKTVFRLALKERSLSAPKTCLCMTLTGLGDVESDVLEDYKTFKALVSRKSVVTIEEQVKTAGESECSSSKELHDYNLHFSNSIRSGDRYCSIDIMLQEELGRYAFFCQAPPPQEWPTAKLEDWDVAEDIHIDSRYNFVKKLRRARLQNISDYHQAKLEELIPTEQGFALGRFVLYDSPRRALVCSCLFDLSNTLLAAWPTGAAAPKIQVMTQITKELRVPGCMYFL